MSWRAAPSKSEKRRRRGGFVAALPAVALSLGWVAATPAEAAEKDRVAAASALFATAAVAIDALDEQRAWGLGDAPGANPFQGQELAVILWDETNGKHATTGVGENVSLNGQTDLVSVQGSN